MVKPSAMTRNNGAVECIPTIKRIIFEYHPESYGFLASATRDANNHEDFARCEDAQPAIERLPNRRIFMGVADGLGGYPQGVDGNSGGKIASDITINTALEYFRAIGSLETAVADRLTNHLFKKLRNFAERKLPPSRVKGSLGRHKLATTLAIAIISDHKNHEPTAIDLYWIGDSRIYFLSSLGLHQLTQDDTVTGADAYDVIFQAPPMSQFLAATMERDWVINHQQLSIDCPGLLMACSDGCFSEWETPWKLEIALQKALDESKGWRQWAWRFKDLLDEIRSDDASLVVHPLHLNNFQQFQSLRKKNTVFNAARIANNAARKKQLTNKQIWLQTYKPTYESTPAIKASAPAPVDIANLETKHVPQDPIWVTKPKVSKRVLILAWFIGVLSAIPLAIKLSPLFLEIKHWIKTLWPFT